MYETECYFLHLGIFLTNGQPYSGVKRQQLKQDGGGLQGEIKFCNSVDIAVS